MICSASLALTAGYRYEAGYRLRPTNEPVIWRSACQSPALPRSRFREYSPKGQLDTSRQAPRSLRKVLSSMCAVVVVVVVVVEEGESETLTLLRHFVP